MGISHRRNDALMAHQFLDGTQIHPGHDQPACKGMSEAVLGEVCYLSPHTDLWKPLARREFRKHIGAFCLRGELNQNLPNQSVYGDVPPFTLLGARDGDHAVAEIDMFPAKPAAQTVTGAVLLRAAHTGEESRENLGFSLRRDLLDLPEQSRFLVIAEITDSCIVLRPVFCPPNWIGRRLLIADG
jgi:hypothetical protein